MWMVTRMSLVVVFFSVFGSTGCGLLADKLGKCHVPSSQEPSRTMFCVDYFQAPTTPSSAREDCRNANGTYFESGDCSRENLVGTCTVVAGSTYYYYSPDYEPISAEASCTLLIGAFNPQ